MIAENGPDNKGSLKCSICSHTEFMNKTICQNCFWKANMESHRALMGEGKFDVLDYELQNIKEELKQIREIIQELLPKKKEIKWVVKDLW